MNGWGKYTGSVTHMNIVLHQLISAVNSSNKQYFLYLYMNMCRIHYEFTAGKLQLISNLVPTNHPRIQLSQLSLMSTKVQFGNNISVIILIIFCIY